MSKSNAFTRPKSRILEKGYINVYSNLNKSEKRQLLYNRLYKKLNPTWDNTMILLCKRFEEDVAKLKVRVGERGLLVLDAGCGNGNYVIDEFRDKIALACGVDLKPDFTKKNVCLDEIKFSTLETIPYDDDKFDLVLSLWVLEHLENPKKVIEEIHRVLKPGGYFIFATPHKNSVLLLLKRLFSFKWLNLAANHVLYGRKARDVFDTYYLANDMNTLQELLQEAGFEDIKLTFNYDPGYTSFGRLTFKISNVLAQALDAVGLSLFKFHIVGVCRK